MDDSSDQSQATNQDTTQQPVASVDQVSVETPPAQEPKTETQTNPIPSETPTTQTSPSSEPTTSVTSEPPPAESPQPETPASTETPPQLEQAPVTPLAETQPSVSPPVINIPALHYPFSGNVPVTFAFGAQSDNEEIKKKFQEWGIIGHNGLDFGLTSGTEVYPCDSGKVIQSGDNGDFGISITIQHSWGQSIYGHLQETKVKEGDEIQVNKIIGLSGSSGAAFGEHLHFAIKPNNPDLNNGYLGFIDPAPFLSLPSQKEEPKQETTETPPVQTPPIEEHKPPEPVIQQPEITPQQPPELEPTINIEPEKPVEPPQISQNPQAPQVNDEEIQKQVDEKLKVELDNRRQKANKVRSQKKEDHLNKIFEFVRDKKVVTNEDVRDFLHVSQSTATNYLTEMVNRGMLKKEGDRGGAKYSI